jgi:hypothetical protein
MRCGRHGFAIIDQHRLPVRYEAERDRLSGEVTVSGSPDLVASDVEATTQLAQENTPAPDIECHTDTVGGDKPGLKVGQWIAVGRRNCSEGKNNDKRRFAATAML